MGGRHITIVCSSNDVINSFKRALQTDERVENKLRQKGKNDIADVLKETFLPDDTDLKFVLQDKPLGTAHVLYCAQKEIGDRHVVIIFPDDIILSKDEKNPHLKKLVDEFLKNPKRVLITGLWREDVSNNAILVNNRIVEKPKNPTSHIAGMSPNVLPNELIKYIVSHGEKRMQMALETGKEWLYMDSANDFLDDGGEANGFAAEMFLKSDDDLMMDTGTLPLYELAQLHALLKLSRYKEQNRELVKELLKD
jgi:UTP-glucose-1-phosphate uridylyltransferase